MTPHVILMKCVKKKNASKYPVLNVVFMPTAMRQAIYQNVNVSTVTLEIRSPVVIPFPNVSFLKFETYNSNQTLSLLLLNFFRRCIWK